MKADHNQTAGELRAIAHRLLELSDIREQRSPSSASEPSRSHRIQYDDFTLAVYASQVLGARRARNEYVPIELLGEPSWDLMLDLFVMQFRGQTVSISSACIASNAPATTALRWIKVLENLGLVERVHCPSDQRVRYIRLTVRGGEMIRLTLSHQLSHRDVAASKVAPFEHQVGQNSSGECTSRTSRLDNVVELTQTAPAVRKSTSG